jgi:hypothetical protein
VNSGCDVVTTQMVGEEYHGYLMATWTAAAARRGTRKARARLTSDPHQSNRAIAQAAGVHHKTVGRLRELLESEGLIPIIRGRGATRHAVREPRADLIGVYAAPSRPDRFKRLPTPDEEDGRLCRVTLVFEYVDEVVPADVRRGTGAHDAWFTAHRRRDWVGVVNFPTSALLDAPALLSELERGLPKLARSAIGHSTRRYFDVNVAELTASSQPSKR